MAISARQVAPRRGHDDMQFGTRVVSQLPELKFLEDARGVGRSKNMAGPFEPFVKRRVHIYFRDLTILGCRQNYGLARARDA